MSFLTSDFNLLEEAETQYVDIDGIDLTESTQINYEMEVTFANLRESTIIAEYQMEVAAIKESAGLALTESAREALTEKAEESTQGFFSKAWDAIKAAWAKVKSFFSGLWDRLVSVVMGDKKWLADEKVSGVLKSFKGTVSAKVFSKVAKADVSGLKGVVNALPTLGNLKVGEKGLTTVNVFASDYNKNMKKVVKSVTGSEDAKGSISTAMQGFFLGKDEAEQACAVAKIYAATVSTVLPAVANIKNLNKLIMMGESQTEAAIKTAVAAAGKGEGEAKKQANATIAQAKAATGLYNQVLAGATSVVGKYRSQCMGVLRSAYGQGKKSATPKKESVEFGFSLFDEAEA